MIVDGPQPHVYPCFSLSLLYTPTQILAKRPKPPPIWIKRAAGDSKHQLKSHFGSAGTGTQLNIEFIKHISGNSEDRMNASEPQLLF